MVSFERHRIGGQAFAFAPGEAIHMENSRKRGLEAFARLAWAAGRRHAQSWTDAAGLFSVHALEAS